MSSEAFCHQLLQFYGPPSSSCGQIPANKADTDPSKFENVNNASNIAVYNHVFWAGNVFPQLTLQKKKKKLHLTVMTRELMIQFRDANYQLHMIEQVNLISNEDICPCI